MYRSNLEEDLIDVLDWHVACYELEEVHLYLDLLLMCRVIYWLGNFLERGSLCRGRDCKDQLSDEKGTESTEWKSIGEEERL